jgi:hypothetical protein
MTSETLMKVEDAIYNLKQELKQKCVFIEAYKENEKTLISEYRKSNRPLYFQLKRELEYTLKIREAEIEKIKSDLKYYENLQNALALNEVHNEELKRLERGGKNK